MATSVSAFVHHTGWLETPDHVQLFHQLWIPKNTPRAAMVIIHGLAEHSSRYVHVADALAREGIAVAAPDLRGHGRSQGRRAYVPAFDLLLRDVEIYLERVKEEFAGLPLFLFGHSMGGAIVALFGITRQPDFLNGLILSGAALKISDSISPLLVKLSAFLGTVLPWLPTVRLNPDHLSRDTDVVEMYSTDELVYHGGTPARTGREIVRATRRIQEAAEQLTLPVLIMHGTGDQITDFRGSQYLYIHAGSTDKTLKLYDGFYHEILNEPQKHLVLKDLLHWLEERI